MYSICEVQPVGNNMTPDQPLVSSSWDLPTSGGGDAAVDCDLTKSDDEEPDTGAGNKERKKLGIPEMDPDGLPSASINKTLILWYIINLCVQICFLSVAPSDVSIIFHV